MKIIKFIATVACFTIGYSCAAQTGKIKLRVSRSSTEQNKSFILKCVSHFNIDDMLPIGADIDLSTIDSIPASIQIRSAIALKDGCNGIYYYKLNGGYWQNPSFRNSSGPPSSYFHYLIILNGKATVFKTDDLNNKRKYLSIRPDLIKAIGRTKTDSISKSLLLGYKELY